MSDPEAAAHEARDRRLQFELEQMQQLCRDSSLVSFTVNDEHLPEQYLVEYRCKGLTAPNQSIEWHVVHIMLPQSFPRRPPNVRFKTPIFHPNIRSIMDDKEEFEQLLAMAGGPEQLKRQMDENPRLRELFDWHICLDALDVNWSPALSLYEICVELGAMIQYQRFNVDDPLNHNAARWTRWAVTQPGLLPVDARDLRDLLPVAALPEPEANRGVRIIHREKLEP